MKNIFVVVHFEMCLLCGGVLLKSIDIRADRCIVLDQKCVSNELGYVKVQTRRHGFVDQNWTVYQESLFGFH